jgi:hypothetical protein
MSGGNINLLIKDIMTCSEDYILHQCDCISVEGVNLTGQIFHKYPVANTYKNRSKGIKDVPGTIFVAVAPNGQKIVNMYAQYTSRVPLPNSDNDSREKRLEYFSQCLSAVQRILLPNETIAIPYHIGCDSMGGEWSSYLGLINQFAQRTSNNQITIYMRRN